MGILRTLTGCGQTFAGIFRILTGIWRIVLGAVRITMGVVQTAKGVVRTCIGAIQALWAFLLTLAGLQQFLVLAFRPRALPAAAGGLAPKPARVQQNGPEARSEAQARPERPLPTYAPPSPIFWGAEMCRLPAIR
jgi:hypothetical protein